MEGSELRRGRRGRVHLKKHLTHGQISRQRHLICSVHISPRGVVSHTLPRKIPSKCAIRVALGVGCDLLSYEGIVLCLFLICSLPMQQGAHGMKLQFDAAQGQIWLRMLPVLCLLQIMKQLFVENAIVKLRRLAGREGSLRPLKFLWDLCQVSDLRANVLGRIVLEGILMLLAYSYLAEGGCTCSKRGCTRSSTLE